MVCLAVGTVTSAVLATNWSRATRRNPQSRRGTTPVSHGVFCFCRRGVPGLRVFAVAFGLSAAGHPRAGATRRVPGRPRRSRFPLLCQDLLRPGFPALFVPRIGTLALVPVAIFTAFARVTPGAGH